MTTYYKTITGDAYIESIQRYDTQLSYRFDRENKVRAIAGVANSIGYEWWVNKDDILCFFKQRGHDKSATITLSDEIISVDQSFDASKVIDKLTVVGMGPGSTHLEVTVGTGEMEGVFSEKDIHDIDTLTSFANAALNQTKEAKHRMFIEIIGTERTDIELGDTIHVTYLDAGIDGNYRIISMELVSGVAGDLTKLEIAVPQFRVTETLMNLDRRADAEDYHPQGAPSILTLARADNVDSTHSLKMKFYVPPEAVDMGKLQIKEARVALTLEAFRAYSTGAASGGGQTTSAGGGQTSSGGSSHNHTISGQSAESAGSHRHKVFTNDDSVAWSDPPYRHILHAPSKADGTDTTHIYVGRDYATLKNIYTEEAAGAHTHTITGTTSSSEASHTHTVSDHTHSVNDHTHGIAYGIYESTSPSNVYIKLNGDQIAGPFNADSHVDITTEFLNKITTYGWNTLEFTSSQLGKIGATLFMRLFLQAS